MTELPSEVGPRGYAEPLQRPPAAKPRSKVPGDAKPDAPGRADPAKPAELPVRHTFVHYDDPSLEAVERAPTVHTWPTKLEKEDVDNKVDDAYYSDGRRRYDACKVVEIPFQMCPKECAGCGDCPGPCRPFWRHVFQVEVRMLQAAQWNEEKNEVDLVPIPTEWCGAFRKGSCNYCHSKACWPDLEFYKKIMRGR